MSDPEHSMPRQFEALSKRVDELCDRVDALSRQVADLSAAVKSTDDAVSQNAPESPPVDALRISEQKPATELEAAGNLTTVAFLSNVAVVCFLLVFALILRIIVDRDIIDQQFGTLLGVAYAIALIACGYYRYAQSRGIIPVYNISGALLLLSIVYETHSRFGLLSTPMAYSLLTLALIAMAAMGFTFQVAAPLTVGVVGASLVGLALDFPHQHYPYLTGLLFLANVAAYLAIRIQRCRWLIWFTLAVTLIFWLVWTVKVRALLLKGIEPKSDLALSWFLPALIFFSAMYIAIVVWSVLRENWAYPELERALPVINVVWAYLAAWGFVTADSGREDRVAAVGACAALAHIALAVAIARTKGRQRRPTTTFTFAAVVLLAISLPAAVGNILIAMLLWSGTAFGIAVISWIRENRQSRGLSYIFQVFACGMALNMDAMPVLGKFEWSVFIVALILTAACLLHYRWCRVRAPKPENLFFRLAAILLLLTAFSYGFVAARMALFAVLNSIQIHTPDNFHAGQSILINSSALAIMYLGLRWKNGELFAAACCAALIGAGKVFGYDLIHIKDLPLVLSIFMFGITAAGGSLLWKRWQQLPVPQPETGENPVVS